MKAVSTFFASNISPHASCNIHRLAARTVQCHVTLVKTWYDQPHRLLSRCMVFLELSSETNEFQRLLKLWIRRKGFIPLNNFALQLLAPESLDEKFNCLKHEFWFPIVNMRIKAELLGRLVTNLQGINVSYFEYVTVLP